MFAKLIVPLAVVAVLVSGGRASAQYPGKFPGPYKPFPSYPSFPAKPYFPPPVYVAPKPIFVPPVYPPPVFYPPKPVYGWPYGSPYLPGYGGWLSPWFKW